jgi:protein phosphatase 2C family protein 2/3
MDMMDNHRARSFGGLGGRIILLGDGTEINANDPDAELFDHDDEDGDLEHQVHKAAGATSSDEEEEEGETEKRSQREGTPGPTSAGEKVPEEVVESPSSVATEKSGDDAKPAETSAAAVTSKPAEEKAAEKA